MDDIPDSAFRLKWQRTWPGEKDDFIAREGPHHYCRIIRTYPGHPSDAWQWTASRDAMAVGRGFAGSAREAALAAEAAYFGEGRG